MATGETHPDPDPDWVPRPGKDSAAQAAMDDQLDRLWTPHRMDYIKGENKPADSSAGQHCPFCRAPGQRDEDGLVVARGTSVYAVLNLYPYNAGHLLICPYRHFADYQDLGPDEAAEMVMFTRRALHVLGAAMQPQGFNLGINQGDIAGAGIAGHLHQHIVPRWSGDSNFMPIVGRTRVLPQELPQTRAVLAQAWADD